MHNYFRILARGPQFRVNEKLTGFRQAVLLTRSRIEEGREAFIVAIQVVSEKHLFPGRSLRRAHVPHFTHAVRLFCDYVLEQAQAEDLRSDRSKAEARRARTGSSHQ